MSNLLDFLTYKERQGCTVRFDLLEQFNTLPDGSVIPGIRFKVFSDTRMEYTGLIGSKQLGEWIKTHNAA